MKNLSSRRGFVKNAAAGLGMLTMPSVLSGKTDQAKLLKIVCVGGHPDDPESGCGGTLAKFAAAGHGVTIIYLTRGEAGIPGKSHSEAADIRSSESIEACKILRYKICFCRSN